MKNLVFAFALVACSHPAKSTVATSPTATVWTSVLDQQPCGSPPPPKTCSETQTAGATCATSGEMCVVGCNEHLICK